MGNNGNRPQTLDRLKKKQASTVKVKISMSDDIATQLNEAENAVSLLQMQIMSDSENEDLKAKLASAEAKLTEARNLAEEDAITFVFRSIGRKAYDRLVTAHPPTDAAKAEAVKQGANPEDLSWDPETFPPALMAAAIVHPHLSEEDIQEMWNSEDWSGTELQNLYYAAIAAQQKSRVIQMGNA